MDIVKTLENCIVAIGAMRPRVDQPDIRNIAEAVIHTLKEVIGEINRLEQEKKDQAASADEAAKQEERKDAAVDNEQGNGV